MHQYVNRFSVAVSNDQPEVMLSLLQTCPIVPNTDGATESTGSLPADTFSVADIVMTKQSAKNLATLLLSLLEKQD